MREEAQADTAFQKGQLSHLWLNQHPKMFQVYLWISLKTSSLTMLVGRNGWAISLNSAETLTITC